MKRATLVILASGSGTLFEYLVRQSQDQVLRAKVVGLVSSRALAPVNERAKKLGVPDTSVNPKEFDSHESWARQLIEVVDRWKPDWIVLAGYTLKLPDQLLEAYPNRVINTHPSLLPKYGGKGMYGKRVHEAVLKAGEVETGITVHTVTPEYDSGPILGQKRISMKDIDSVKSLENKVKSLEREFYVEVLNKIVS